jgi:hypothetical protein
MWDRLNSHFSDEAAHAIYNAGHLIIPRPSYYPCDGPIEYINNQIEIGLKNRLYGINNNADLLRNLNQVLMNIRNIDSSFVDCGYT